MSLIIGIDTGGTYTDAVIYDKLSGKVMARGKSPTTHDDLSRGIGGALDTLPRDLLLKAETVALSTTLATNACVEGKGGRARLLMMGTSRRTLEWVEADKKYGLDYDAVVCVPDRGKADGMTDASPDWDAIMTANDEFFRKADAISVVELNAIRNGGAYENAAGEALSERYRVPFVKANDLVNGLNIMERGATALLNARLIPVVDEFVRAVGEALAVRGLDVRRVIVRSDGTLMAEKLAMSHPVETILSGPAASVCGCRALTDVSDALIVDMGGTTTDISILRGGSARMSEGINIGGWRTQIQGVFIDTIALGGDTRVKLVNREPVLDTRRVEPLCAAAARWPVIKEELKNLVKSKRIHGLPLHEFLYLVRTPENLDKYTDTEKHIIGVLSDGPKIIGGGELDSYRPDSARLESEGVVMRAGLTPTDIMHIRGDFSAFDAEASRLAARFVLQNMPDMDDNPEDLDRLCGRIYGLVKKRLFENVVRVFLEATYPDVFGKGPDDQMKAFIERKWEKRGKFFEPGFFDLKLGAEASLVGVGAPIHIFLPEVAEALGVRCVIPENSAVANAIGAAAAEITSRVSVEIRSALDDNGVLIYTVHARDAAMRFEKYGEALEAAKEAAGRLAEAEAKDRGAGEDIAVELNVENHSALDRGGAEIDLGTTVTAVAGRSVI